MQFRIPNSEFDSLSPLLPFSLSPEPYPEGVRKSRFVSHTVLVNQDQSNTLPLATEKMSDEIAVSEPDAGSPAAGTTVELTADQIRERMTMIRLRIEEESDEVVAQVNALSDWRSYVRRYPWASVGAAAALGFVLVPSKGKPDTEGFPRDPKKQSAAFTTDELRSVLIGAAKKAGTAYASRSLGAILNSIPAADDRA